RSSFRTGTARSKLLPAPLSELAVAVTRRASTPLFARSRFIYRQRASGKFLAVEFCQSCVRLRFVVHGDERKTARFAGHAIHHQRHFADLAVFFEKILKIVFRGLKRE